MSIDPVAPGSVQVVVGPFRGPVRFLLAAPFFDELLCAFAVVGMPLIRDGLGLSYQQAGMLLSVGGLASMVFEPPLLALASRGHQGRWMLWALAANAVFCTLAATAPNYPVLLVAFAAWSVGDGLALCAAQAILVAQDQAGTERMLVRWTLWASVGDLLGPLVITALTESGVAWRGLFLASAGIWLAYLLIAIRRGIGRRGAWRPRPGAARMSLRQTFRRAHRSPGLVRCALALEALVLLDEVAVAFAGLYLRDVVGAGPGVTTLTLTASMAGAVVGLLLMERAVAVLPRRLAFAVSAFVCSASLAALLLWPVMAVAVPALVLAGVGGVTLYPIMKAEAYRALPNEPALVEAYLACWAPIGVTLPWLVGLVADHTGLPTGLACIAATPVAILLIAPRVCAAG